MAYAIGASFLITLLVFMSSLLGSRRSNKRIAALERERLIDPASLIGTMFALERELADSIEREVPLSVAEITLTDPGRAIEAGHALRSVCWHGWDQLFSFGSYSGHFLILTLGTLDPERQCQFFLEELRAREMGAKIGWAYTRAQDAETRKLLRAAASRALMRVTDKTGYSVELVDQKSWPNENGMQLLGDLRERRHCLCLTSFELSNLVGLSVSELRRIENGRACEPRTAQKIDTALQIIEKTLVAVDRLRSLQIVAGNTLACAQERQAVAAGQGSETAQTVAEHVEAPLDHPGQEKKVEVG